MDVEIASVPAQSVSFYDLTPGVWSNNENGDYYIVSFIPSKSLYVEDVWENVVILTNNNFVPCIMADPALKNMRFSLIATEVTFRF